MGRLNHKTDTAKGLINNPEDKVKKKKNLLEHNAKWQTEIMRKVKIWRLD